MNSGVDGVDYESIDPIDIKYKQLKCEITPLETDVRYRIVEKYIHDSHGQTHRLSWISSRSFKCCREGEKRFQQFEDTPNRSFFGTARGCQLRQYPLAGLAYRA